MPKQINTHNFYYSLLAFEWGVELPFWCTKNFTYNTKHLHILSWKRATSHV